MKKFSRSLAVTAAVAMLALAGCSDDATPDTTPTKEPTASETNTPGEPTETKDGEGGEGGEEPTNTPVTVEPGADGKVVWCDPAEQAPFTGPAADKFGAKNVMDAYCTMVELQMDYSFLDTLWDKEEGFTAQEFSPVREYLGEDARADYDAAVAKVVNGTDERTDMFVVGGLMWFNLIGGSPYTLDAPANFNQRFSPAKAWVDTRSGRERLGLRFTVASDVAVVRTKDQKDMAWTAEKEITFWLTPGSNDGLGKSWYIDGYDWDMVPHDPVDRADLIKDSE